MSLTKGVTGADNLRRRTVTGPSFKVDRIGKSVRSKPRSECEGPHRPEGRKLTLQENPLRIAVETVPKTDTGRQIEYIKGCEQTLVKELGKMAP